MGPLHMTQSSHSLHQLSKCLQVKVEITLALKFHNFSRKLDTKNFGCVKSSKDLVVHV